jgi:hypothetical protein
MHLVAVSCIGWLATYLGVTCLGWTFGFPPQLLLAGGIIFVGGWLVGSLILGAYLLVSLNRFGRHANEAFSALAIPDYKNFLRLHLDAEGKLTIFPVGIARVPRKWGAPPAGGRAVSELVSNDPNATPPVLIEAPVMVRHTSSPLDKEA